MTTILGEKYKCSSCTHATYDHKRHRWICEIFGEVYGNWGCELWEADG